MIGGLQFMIVLDLFLRDEDMSATVTVTKTDLKYFILKHMMYLWFISYSVFIFWMFCSGCNDCMCPVSVNVSVIVLVSVLVKLKIVCCDYKLLKTIR